MSCAEVPPFASGSAAPLPLTFIATPPGMAPCFTSPAEGLVETGAAAEACMQRQHCVTPQVGHDTHPSGRSVTRKVLAEARPNMHESVHVQLVVPINAGQLAICMWQCYVLMHASTICSGMRNTYLQRHGELVLKFHVPSTFVL